MGISIIIRIPKFDHWTHPAGSFITQVMMMKMQGKCASITSVVESILHVKVQEQL